MRQLSAQLAQQLDEVIAQQGKLESLSAAVTRQLDQVIAQQQRLESLSTTTSAEVMVLLTALRPLRLPSAAATGPSKIDEHIEDMIDPEFGLGPARKAVEAAARHILRGYEGLRWPPRGSDSDDG